MLYVAGEEKLTAHKPNLGHLPPQRELLGQSRDRFAAPISKLQLSEQVSSFPPPPVSRKGMHPL